MIIKISVPAGTLEEELKSLSSALADAHRRGELGSPRRELAKIFLGLIDSRAARAVFLYKDGTTEQFELVRQAGSAVVGHRQV